MPDTPFALSGNVSVEYVATFTPKVLFAPATTTCPDCGAKAVSMCTCQPPDPRVMTMLRTQGATLAEQRQTLAHISERVSRVEYRGDADRIWVALQLMQERCEQVARENRVLRQQLNDLSTRLSLVERQQAIHDQAIEELQDHA